LNGKNKIYTLDQFTSHYCAKKQKTNKTKNKQTNIFLSDPTKYGL